MSRKRRQSARREKDHEGRSSSATGWSTPWPACTPPARSTRRCWTPAASSRASFVLAQLDPLRAVDLLRVPGSGREPEPGNVQHGRAQPRAPGAAGPGRARQPRRLVRVARPGLRPVGAGMGAAPGLGRPARAAGAGAGHAGGGAGAAGGALRSERFGRTILVDTGGRPIRLSGVGSGSAADGARECVW